MENNQNKTPLRKPCSRIYLKCSPLIKISSRFAVSQLKARNWAFILAFFTLFSCAKDDEEVCPSKTPGYGDVSVCLSGFLFDVGSYWIYEHTNTQEIDSTYVSVQSANTYNSHGGPGNRCGSSYTDYVSVLYKSSRREQMSNVMMWNEVNDTGPGTTGHNFFRCSTPPLDSMIVANVTYYNVIPAKTRDNGDLYYKNKIGVIRMVEYDSLGTADTFDLVRHEVQLFDLPD